MRRGVKREQIIEALIDVLDQALAADRDRFGFYRDRGLSAYEDAFALLARLGRAERMGDGTWQIFNRRPLWPRHLRCLACRAVMTCRFQNVWRLRRWLGRMGDDLWVDWRTAWEVSAMACDCDHSRRKGGPR